MTTLAQRKQYLKKQISSVHSENEMTALEDFFVYLQQKNEFAAKYTSQMKKNISLEELAKKQSYKGISKKDWEIFRKKMNISEPLDQLIASINS